MQNESLIEIRKSKKLTQQDVATNLGVACNTYCRYETGARHPSIKILKILSELFDVPIDELIK